MVHVNKQVNKQKRSETLKEIVNTNSLKINHFIASTINCNSLMPKRWGLIF